MANSLRPPEIYVDSTDWDEVYKRMAALAERLKRQNAECTCGTEKAGGGIHSEWCDKAEA